MPALPTTSSGFRPALILGGRYRLLRVLGRGGQGEVWHAFDVKLRMEVALKALRADLIRDDHARDLLRSEVRSARQVVSANVCRVFDLVVEDGHEMVSMEFVDGTTLAELLAEKGPLDFGRGGEIAGQLLAGLEAIHAAGFVHRDLKPENVMLTLSKRVVVMDFGIARSLTDTQAETIVGTPGYMSPEQADGLLVDARADVFSAAVILAEMVSPRTTGTGGSANDRLRLWAELRRDPPQVSAGPWSAVLRRALSRSPGARYSSAGALARALEVEQRETSRAEQSPYPGLLHFTPEDTRFFFGRELEVESLLRQLRRPRLRAVIGPSGAGKSSFVRAGLVPALPAGWSAIVCAPADRPFAALAQALAPKLAGDPEVGHLLPHLEDFAASVFLARRWRQRHDHALLVVDQAEELFTLNPIEVQHRFSELLGRLVLDADVHVLLSIRDDFLLQCQSFEDLRPAFSDLTPLAPPAGAALRRALVQPALVCGYRFEDERLVEDMLRDVAQERGTLPLLAFALARLWEHRDRERGLLTRRGYEDIGGVAGALAQHAEATLETIGAARVQIVREILRNLVTAEGTRALQGWEELLSAFADRREAEEVLGRLIEARLLTSFEAAPEDAGTTGHRQVEIIHESLLASWPRLARWRDQDSEGARLRDQLRQAARLWDERGRPGGLLWTGPSFADYVAWRSRYAGRLTALEQAFGKAMETQAGRRRRQMGMAIGTAFAALLVVLVVVSQLWIRSRAAEQRAVQQTLRTEAQQLLALGQLEEDRNPTLAFAHAIAALERADTAEIRRFALRQLWKGPLAFVRSEGSNGGDSSLAFSTDGEWLVDSGTDARVWRRDGSGPFDVGSSFLRNVTAQFASDGRRLVIFGRRRSGTAGVDVIGLPELTLLKRIETPGEGLLAVRGDKLITRAPNGSGADIVLRSLIAGDARRLGFLSGGALRLQFDASGDRYFVSYPGHRQVLASTSKAGAAGQHIVLRTSAPVSSFWLDSNGEQIALRDDTGALRLGSLVHAREPRHLTGSSLKPEERISSVVFDSTGRWIVAALTGQGLRMWDLIGPPDAETMALGRGPVTTIGAVFEPTGRWLTAEDLNGVTFWPLTRRWPSVMRVSAGAPRDVAFDPKGKWIAASAGVGGVEIWPSTGNSFPRRRIAADVSQLAVSPDGQFLATGTRSGSVLILPVAGSGFRELPGFQGWVDAVAFDATGSRIAADGPENGGQRHVIRVFDLQTGAVKRYDPGDGNDINTVAFLPDGRLLIAGFGGLRRLDLETGSFELLLAQPGGAFLGPDGRHVLLLDTGDNVQEPVGTASVYDLHERRGWPLSSHGDQVTLMAWDPSGKRLVTGSRDGIVRVGPATGDEPHLLIGHQGPIWGVRIDPTGRLVASTSVDGTVRIWPMPEGQPPHTWSRDALLDKFRSLTNVRIAPDATSASGYRITFLPFQGWGREPPTW
ncbi:WD40 repeat domain-containing serine/threonine protein kinase [Luteitalea pratensis]|nr:serine/threonine-protein kinase [Luteitalea pratensis]